MSGYPLVLLFATLPAVGNFAGALLAEAFDVSERALSLALHLAAGIVLGVIGIELMPRALEASLPWVPLVAFVVGGALFLGLEHLIGYTKDAWAETTAPARSPSSAGSRSTCSATAS